MTLKLQEYIECIKVWLSGTLHCLVHSLAVVLALLLPKLFSSVAAAVNGCLQSKF